MIARHIIFQVKVRLLIIKSGVKCSSLRNLLHVDMLSI